MSWPYGRRPGHAQALVVGAQKIAPSSEATTSISNSDTKGAEMGSTKTSQRGADLDAGEGDERLPVGGKQSSGISSSMFLESSGPFQEENEFFEAIHKAPTSRQAAEAAGPAAGQANHCATTLAPSSRFNSSISLIDQLLPLQAAQSDLPWMSGAYNMPLTYSNYQSEGALMAAAAAQISGAPDSPLASAFYDGQAFGNSSTMFQVMRGRDEQANRADLFAGVIGAPGGQSSSQSFASGLPDSFAPNQSKPTRSPDHNQALGLSRTYSSVLHHPARLQPAGSSGSSIFDVSQQASSSLSLSGAREFVVNFGSQPMSAAAEATRQQTGRLMSNLIGLSANHSRYRAADPETPVSQNERAPDCGSSAMDRKSSLPAASGIVSVAQRDSSSDRAYATPAIAAGAAKRRNKLPPIFGASANLLSGSDKMDTYTPAGLAAANASAADGNERFSRKVFVGGLPPDIDEEEIKASFRRFGALLVDWPHKAESKSYFPPKGYAFLLFQEESSVQALIDTCFQEADKLYLCVSSPTIKDKPVQIRPWRLSDTDFVFDSTLALDARKTVFVGGVPRPLKASELASIMNNLYGGVCYAGIDTDPELKYPKGAGRVAFCNHHSYIAAISARFVQIRHSDIEKRVEVKPYVLDDQFCDECHGSRCANKFAPFFCANVNCLRYYCDNCWSTVHSQAGREFHKPLVKEGGDRPRASHSYRW